MISPEQKKNGFNARIVFVQWKYSGMCRRWMKQWMSCLLNANTNNRETLCIFEERNEVGGWIRCANGQQHVRVKSQRKKVNAEDFVRGNLRLPLYLCHHHHVTGIIVVCSSVCEVPSLPPQKQIATRTSKDFGGVRLGGMLKLFFSCHLSANQVWRAILLMILRH